MSRLPSFPALPSSPRRRFCRLALLGVVVAWACGPVPASDGPAGAARASGGAATSDGKDPGSVVVVTVSVREAWPRDPSAAIARLAPDGDGHRWWAGTSWAGSEDPLRTLFGLLSGIPPFRISGSVDTPAIRYGLGHRMKRSGRPVLGRIDGPLAGEAMPSSLVPGPRPFFRMRSVLQELRAVEEPFLYWFSVGEVAEPGEPEAFRRIARIVEELGARGALETTMVVVTSLVGDADGRVPLLLRLPTGVPSAPTSSELPLESVGTTMLRHAGFEAGPAALPRWDHGSSSVPSLPVPLLERRRDGELTGLTAVAGGRRMSVEWKPGRMEDCWRRDRPLSCRWSEGGESEPDPESPGRTESARMESALLLALEGLLGT